MLSLFANDHWIPSLEVVHIQLVMHIQLRQLIFFFFYSMKINDMSKIISFIPYTCTCIYCLEQKRKLDNYFCILYYLIFFCLIHIKNV